MTAAPLNDLTAYAMQTEFLLERFTVYRRITQEPPFVHLRGILRECYAGNAVEAVRKYFAFVSSLLEKEYSRYSGNIFCDFILFHILETDNAFARGAARGEWNPPLFEAAKMDLGILGELSRIPMDDILQELLLRLAGKEKKQALPLAGVVWAGDKVAGVAGQKKEQHSEMIALQFSDLPKLTYSEEATEELTVGDAKGTMYSMFLQERNWDNLADELWHFHSICGSGEFLNGRIFLFDGKLTQLDTLADVTFNDLYGFDYQKRMLIKNTLQFINEKEYHHMLLYGAPGMGKTSLALAFMCGSLSNLRVVLLGEGVEFGQLIGLMETLSKQPAKFILFCDGLSLNSKDYENLAKAVGCMKLKNVMICATSDECAAQSVFTMNIELEPLTKNEIIDMVMFLLHAQGINMRKDRLSKVYCSHVSDGGTSRMAKSIAMDILSENE